MRLPPRFMFVETNKRCNLRCTHCDFWQRNDDDRASYPSRERKREVIAEFAELSPAGSIVICGGEPMLDLDEYFAICRDGRDFGLPDEEKPAFGARLRHLASSLRGRTPAA